MPHYVQPLTLFRLSRYQICSGLPFSLCLWHRFTWVPVFVNSLYLLDTLTQNGHRPWQNELFSAGIWDKTGFECLTVGTSAYPVRKMVVVGGNIWCATSNTIKILNSASREIEDMITVGNDETKTIIAIVESGLGVWIAQQGSASLRLLHANSYITLAEVSCTNVVSKMLTNCDEIIRQHKTACLRVTSVMAVKDMLWIGTSAGA